MNELKECPFCGGKAWINSSWANKKKYYMVYAKCNICGSQGKIFVSKENPEETNWENEACCSAVEAWNMRTEKEQ